MRTFAAITILQFVALAGCGGNGSADEATEAAATGPTGAPESAMTTVGEPGGVDDVGLFPFGVYGAGGSSVGAGIGYLEVEEDGSGRLRGIASAGHHDSQFSYSVNGDEIEFMATSGDCPVGAVGTYEWSVEGSVLEVRAVADECRDRRASIDEWNWYPLGDTPVVDAAPTDEPIPVDSAIGRIEWHVVAGPAEGWESLEPIDEGFVALLGDQGAGTDPQLMISDDGMNWRSIAAPPASPNLIATRAEEIYAWSASAVDEVYVSTDLGASWTALAIEDPPVAVTGLAAGPAGVVIFGEHGLWLLEGDEFQQTTSESMTEVLVLDSGFFARSPGGYWVSEDGRRWSEATGVPADVGHLASWGDNVYGATEVDFGVTSTDGGRTWSAPTTRPGGFQDPFVATDVGYFAIEPALFGPAVGVVWASPDDTVWERVLNTWPPLYLFEPVVSGDTILIPGETEWPESMPLDWVGIIDVGSSS